MKKISLIGAGQIGGTMAHILSQKNEFDIVLFDLSAGKASGKALDISNAYDVNIRGTDSYSDIADSDVVIITAGQPRKGDMSRSDLLSINVPIIKNIALNVARYAPNAFVIVVTNPLDIMVHVFYEHSKMNAKQVVGMNLLDSYRLASAITRHLGCRYSDVMAMVIGAHGDTMMPLLRHTSIAGISFYDYIKNHKTPVTSDVIDKIIHETKYGGQMIVKLLGNGSAYYAPAKACVKMAEAYLLNQKAVLSCSVYLDGQYGLKDIYIGAPAVIGANGVESVVELDLNDQEKQMLERSVASIAELISEYKNLNIH